MMRFSIRLTQLFAVAALLACAGPAAAQLGSVTQLTRDAISIFDGNGKFKERRPKWELPKQKGGAKRAAPIVAELPSGHVGILDPNGVTVFLRNSEIETEGRVDPCGKLAAIGGSGRSRVTASEGIGSGMSNARARCGG